MPLSHHSHHPSPKLPIQADLHEDDVIRIDLENKVLTLPFYLGVDREREALVLSIRGTLSTSDLVTDGLAKVRT